MGGADGWLRHPGGPGGLALLFTGAGLTVIAAALIVGVHLPRPPGSTSPELDKGPAERAAVALETIVETLKTIAGASPAPQNLSVTIQLDKDQWQNAAAGLRGIVEGMAGKADGIDAGVKKIAETADRISIDVKGVAKNTGRIERGVRGVVVGVEKVAETADRISTDAKGVAENTGRIERGMRGVVVGVEKVAETADHISTDVKGVAENTGRIERGVRGVAYGTAYVADAMEGVSAHLNDLGHEVDLLRNEVGQLTDRAQPPACDPPNCLGAVHFPHAWPSESEFDRACPDRESGAKWTTGAPDVAQAITDDLEQVIKNWKTQEMRGPIFIVGHASTDGASTYNKHLSERRAKFVECYLRQHRRLKKLTADIEFKPCPTGEKASTGSPRHPDSWYRVVQVFLDEPPVGILEDCGDG